MLEILINIVHYENGEIVILPLGCPSPEAPDVPKHTDGTPGCLLSDKVCPYLNKVYYSHSDMSRSLLCRKGNE